MNFDLSKPILPIGPFDPAVVVSVLLAGVVAWFCGKALGHRTMLVSRRWRRVLYMGPVWVIVGIALTCLTLLLFVASFQVLSGIQQGYITDWALATFLLPPVLCLAVAGMHVLHVPPPEDSPEPSAQP